MCFLFPFFSSTDNWQWEANSFTKLDFGKWEIKIPAKADGSCAIGHLSEVKVIIRNQNGQLLSRLSPWAKYVVQPPKEANQGTNYKQIVWNPPPHDVRIFNFSYNLILPFLNVFFPFYIFDYRDFTSRTENPTNQNR